MISETCFPAFLQSDNGKIRVRFDTNGLLFDNEHFATKFINRIYDLDLQNIKIDITFSVKGTNSKEYNWFAKHDVAYDMSQSNEDEDLGLHPQWRAIYNICRVISNNEDVVTINKKSDSIIAETYFNPCGDVSLTIERGIMNNPSERLFLYGSEELNWDNFGEKLSHHGLELSQTENRIYLGIYPGSIAWRYMRRGGYEFQFKCQRHKKVPFRSYSLNKDSITGSRHHVRLSSYKDSNLKDFVQRYKNGKKACGTICSKTGKPCDFHVVLIPT